MRFLPWLSRTTLFGATLAFGVIGCGATRAPSKPVEEVTTSSTVATLDPSKIIFAMGGHETNLRKCFFRAPSRRGAIRVSWNTDVSGKVHDPRVVESSIDSPDVENCIIERVAALRFGRLEEPARGEWVFVFRLANPRPDADTDDEDEDEDEALVIDESSPGWLDPDRVDSVVQAGYRLYARCYRAGIKRRDGLEGSVRFAFVIDPTGRVEAIHDQGSNLPDLFAIDCVAEAFYALEFPQPERGPVTVHYQMRVN